MRFNEGIGKFETYASSEGFLEIKTSSNRIDWSPNPGDMITKCAAKEDEGDIEGGYLYVRARAISSRVNKNNDGWPSEELAKAYKTFIGRPVFVDHNNSDPTRTRGVIVDAKLHVEDEKTSSLDPYYATAADNHKPPTWIEILIEIDAKTFPKLADAIKKGHIDATSMGANIDRSICSVCANEATAPSDYCSHVKQKGATFEIIADNGEKLRKHAYEDCYGVNFFEDSFVFDPADVTALNIGVDEKPMVLAKEANLPEVVEACPLCNQPGLEDHGNSLHCPHCDYTALKGDEALPHSAAEKTAGWYSCQACNTLLDNGEEHCPKCGGKASYHDGPGNMPPQPGKRGATAKDVHVHIHLDSDDDQDQKEEKKEEREAGWYNCQKCGTLLDDDAEDKCPECGEPIKEHTYPGNMPRQHDKRGAFDGLIRIADGYHVACRECGHHMINVQDDTDGMLYCPKCDRTESNLSTLAPFLEHVAASEECPFCGEPSSPSTLTCPHCGRPKDDKPSKTAEFGEGGQGVDKERVINFEPQEDMVKAPQKVDTLKDDIECPNCHSDHLEADPDGIMRCPTCSYEQPPEGLDNPDLTRAEREDEGELSGNKNPEDVVRAGEEDADLKPASGGPAEAQDKFIEPIKPFTSATKDYNSTGVISGMIWKRKIQTNSAAEANKILKRVTAGSVETPIEYQGGIHFGTHAAFKNAGIEATVQYPGAPAPLPIPGNAMQHFMMQMNAVKAQGLQNPGQLVVRVDAPDDQLDQAVQLIHSGGTAAHGGGGAPEGAPAPHEGALKQQPKKKVLMPQADNKNTETVVSDQLAPVTSDRRVIKREETPDGHRTEQIIEETGTLGLDDDEPKAEKKDEDSSSEETKSENENSEPKSESGDDNRPDFLKEKDEKKEPVAASVKESDSDDDGDDDSEDSDDPHHSHFIQEAIKHKGRLTAACGGPPHEHLDKVKELAKKGDGLGAAARLYLNVLRPANEDKESSVLARLAIAEEAVELGLVAKEKKLAFIGQLEGETEESLETRREMLELFRSAGTTKRVAHTSRALPRLSSVGNLNVPTNNGHTNVDEIPFEAVFLP